VYRWMFDVASPRLNGDGSFGGFIGSAIDVTDQKLAQQALEKVSGQLIEAREKERSRIARELHDDICQRQLHSSKLEYLGVAAAIRGFCQEFSRQHEVSIEFTENDVPRHPPKDTSLCLFRVTQEALRNAVKYSGASEFRVELTAREDEIQLIVRDQGKGFDVEAARKTNGLGLVSMQERPSGTRKSLCRIEAGDGHERPCGRSFSP